MIGFGNLDLLSLRNVARRLGVHICVVHRWVLRGVNGKKLRATDWKGEKWISEDELALFLQNLNRLQKKS